MADVETRIPMPTKSHLRLLGFAWVACMATVIRVIAGVDLLSDFRPSRHIDFSARTYLELMACLAPGLVAILLTRRSTKH